MTGSRTYCKLTLTDEKPDLNRLESGIALQRGRSSSFFHGMIPLSTWHLVLNVLNTVPILHEELTSLYHSRLYRMYRNCMRELYQEDLRLWIDLTWWSRETWRSERCEINQGSVWSCEVWQVLWWSARGSVYGKLWVFVWSSSQSVSKKNFRKLTEIIARWRLGLVLGWIIEIAVDWRIC